MSVQDCVFDDNTLPRDTLHFSQVQTNVTSPHKDDPTDKDGKQSNNL